MAQDFSALPTTILSRDSTYRRPDNTHYDKITLSSPATHAMTDLNKVAAATIEPGAGLLAANQKMIANQVRLLLVCDASNTVLGIITATDTLSEKPVKFMHKVDCSYEDITVQDIMTPHDELEVMQMVDVENARVGDVVQNLKQSGRQHALVVEINETHLHESIRAIFSATQISKQLGRQLDITDRANTFAELGQALVAG